MQTMVPQSSWSARIMRERLKLVGYIELGKDVGEFAFNGSQNQLFGLTLVAPHWVDEMGLALIGKLRSADVARKMLEHKLDRLPEIEPAFDYLRIECAVAQILRLSFTTVHTLGCFINDLNPRTPQETLAWLRGERLSRSHLDFETIEAAALLQRPFLEYFERLRQ
jgi:hypothetical protein